MVVEAMLALRVEEYAAGLVAHEGVVFIGIPQPLHHVQVLGRAAVALGVINMLLTAKVAGRAFQAGGDYVPTGAAAADQVQRGKLAGDVEGLGVGRGQRGHQADLRRRTGDGRKQGQWLQTVEEMRRGIRGDVGAVDDEDQIEFGRFCLLRLGTVPVDIDTGIAGDLRVQPFVLRSADAGEDGTEFELPG